MENKCSNGAEHCACAHRCSCGREGCAAGKTAANQADQAVAMWTCAGHQAWKEVHVDLLKAKILKAWGPRMEQTADAVIEEMGLQWQAMMSQEKAKDDLKVKIAEIFAQRAK